MLWKKVKTKTHVPVPQVLAWSYKPESSRVGTEYIIMEHVSGVALNDVWSQMTELQRIEFIESMGGLMKELCSLNFGAYGSLYLNAADTSARTHPIDEHYCIGPHCGRQFWGYHGDLTSPAAVPLGYQGPCKSSIKHLSMYISADFRQGKACLPFSRTSIISARRL